MGAAFQRVQRGQGPATGTFSCWYEARGVNARRGPAWPGELLALRDRRLAAPTFSPGGLYLVGVGYDTGWGLPAQHDGLRMPAIGPSD